ncbi:c-type cytochrome [Caballeronia sp. SBC2]|uniref:c-type cytochrome n=1 Tax=unclassified Caballeronia TaxID=2646786 RepID=UPI003519EEA8
MRLTVALVLCALLTRVVVAQTSSEDEQRLVDRGGYLAKVGDCVACHTASAGQPYAGGFPLTSGIGTIYSTNITPDLETGIGRYTYDDFARALRQGIAKDGYTLYPAMPYPSFSRVSDDDMHALYAYFMQGVSPVKQANRAEDIRWPLSMRWPLHVWRWMFVPKAVQFTPPPNDSPEVARGAYLVEGLGHCGACHTPRGIAMQELALSEKDGPKYLTGGRPMDEWVATSLRGDLNTGLGQWSESDLATFLKEGSTERTAAFGGMTDVVMHSTQYLTDEDRTSIVRYLKTLPGRPDEAPLSPDASVSTALHSGDVRASGSDTYLNSCAACHRTDGKGYASTFPALALNPVVNSDDPTSLIHIVLSGSATPATDTTPTKFAMPPYGWRLSDTEVATVLTLIRSSWGNQASRVEASDVAKVRATLPVAALGAAPSP